jgi:hypothetical protein
VVRDDLRGSLLAPLVAAPVVVICCGGAVFCWPRSPQQWVGEWEDGLITLLIAAGPG